MLPENLCYGSARGLSIGHVVDDIPEFFSGLAILFTSVDSDSNAAAHIYMNEKGVRAYENAALVEENYVEEFLKDGWFYDGFEAIYLCRSINLPKESPVSDRRFTSDGCDFGIEVPEEFPEIFGALKAVRYLSDGCFLNYVCEPQFAEQIKKLALQ